MSNFGFVSRFLLFITITILFFVTRVPCAIIWLCIEWKDYPCLGSIESREKHTWYAWFPVFTEKFSIIWLKEVTRVNIETGYPSDTWSYFDKNGETL